MLPIPDLLYLQPRFAADPETVRRLLELAFLGKGTGQELDRIWSVLRGDRIGWNLDLFAHDLFVRELIAGLFVLEIDGQRHAVNQGFLYRILADPPTDAAGVSFRQEILRELDANPDLLAACRRLYQELVKLLSMFQVPDHAASLDVHTFRLDLLRQARDVIDRMVTDFQPASSGLRRLHEVGREIQATQEYRILADFLDHESRLATLTVDLDVGADGRLKQLRIHKVREHRENRFYRSPPRRWFERLKLLFLGYPSSRQEILQRLLHQVFLEISPALTLLAQLVGHLEFYLVSFSFRDRVQAAGLATCLASFDPTQPLALRQVWNPLLLAQAQRPVATTVAGRVGRSTTLLTGPNSGGKTRLLQAIGLTQLLAQSGTFTSAGAANLPLLHGLFVSLVESETAGQAEGRLGRELMRIRTLFESLGAPSMVILDELCSGTNPTEGIEIFSQVLHLLDRLETTSFISTHFLDFARELERTQPLPALDFLQVEVDRDERSTYQFVSGVAATSLAVVTARRLGVTFDELAQLIDRRRAFRG